MLYTIDQCAALYILTLVFIYLMPRDKDEDPVDDCRGRFLAAQFATVFFVLITLIFIGKELYS